MQWHSQLGRHGVALGCVVVCALAILPVQARAGTASLSGSTLHYTASPGEVNNTSIFLLDGAIQVRELGTATVSAGAGCVSVDVQMASCGSPTALDVNLGDGDDHLFSNDLGGTAHGGAGNDTLSFGNFSSGTMFGDDGNDTLYPSFGAWTLNGGNDDDLLTSGCSGGCTNQGPISATGGGGTDTFSYSGYSVPVLVSLDGVANDGPGLHKDNIGADVENLVGGTGGDALAGTSAGNRLDGGGGDGDVLTGGGGADTLIVAGSIGQLSGGDGDDDLVVLGAAVTDFDVLSGGADTDTADFSQNTTGTSVSLDSVANDGPGHDNVQADVENVVGTSGSDTLSAVRAATTC